MQPLDDLTSEEREQRNQPVIGFLNRIYAQSVDDTGVEQERILAAVRERLQQNDELKNIAKSSLRSRTQPMMRKGIVNTPMNTSLIQRKTSWSRRIGVLAAVAFVLLLIGSTGLLFKLAADNRNGSAGISSPTKNVNLAEVRSKAHMLVQQFHTEVDGWAKAHPYHDSYDGGTYALNNAYMSAGLGGILDRDLAGARTTADFQAVISSASNALFSLHMLAADAGDTTAYNQMHQSDIQLLNHYNLQHRQVIVVSLAEQSLRVYQDGKLVKAFLVTTGRPEHPAVPGLWVMINRQSPVIFKSSVPKGSVDWYPDTKVNYAMQYTTEQHYIYDAWWSMSYGPGTQFPHKDATGNGVSVNGGIELTTVDMQWLYEHTSIVTRVLIY